MRVETTDVPTFSDALSGLEMDETSSPIRRIGRVPYIPEYLGEYDSAVESQRPDLYKSLHGRILRFKQFCVGEAEHR